MPFWATSTNLDPVYPDKTMYYKTMKERIAWRSCNEPRPIAVFWKPKVFGGQWIINNLMTDFGDDATSKIFCISNKDGFHFNLNSKAPDTPWKTSSRELLNFNYYVRICKQIADLPAMTFLGCLTKNHCCNKRIIIILNTYNILHKIRFVYLFLSSTKSQFTLHFNLKQPTHFFRTFGQIMTVSYLCKSNICYIKSVYSRIITISLIYLSIST